MKNIQLLVVAGWLTLLLGCSEPSQDGEAADIRQTLAGEVFYRERKLLPP